ncbi:MAG: hypothetical protein ABMA64_35530 [Myxococcota bacterium]
MVPQLEGNAAAQSTLPGASSAPDAAGGEAAAAVASLVDAVTILWDARVDGVDDTWSKASAEGPSDTLLELLAGGAVAAVFAATSEFTAPVFAAAAAGAGLSEAVRSLLGEAAGPLVDAAKSGVEDAVSAQVEQTASAGRPPVDGYFLGAKAGLRVETVGAIGAWRAFGARLAEVDGGVDGVRALTRAITQRIVSAEAIQMQRCVVEWMNVIAQCDNGRQGSEKGSDLTRAGSGRSLLDQALGRTPGGIVNVHVRFGPVEDPPEIVSADVSGINDELLGVLQASDSRLDALGLPIFVSGLTASGRGSLELGRNERDLETLETSGDGQQWLDAYAATRLCDPREVPGRVIASVACAKFSSLGVVAT